MNSYKYRGYTISYAFGVHSFDNNSEFKTSADAEKAIDAKISEIESKAKENLSRIGQSGQLSGSKFKELNNILFND